jgi:hypothetical protein
MPILPRPLDLPPPEGMIKVNVDEAMSRDNNCGSVASVFSNSSGQYMGSSAIVFQGLSDPTMLEDLAFCEALTLAADLHVDRVIVAIVCL